MGNHITVEQDEFLQYLCSPDRRLPTNLAARTDMFVKGLVTCSCMIELSEVDIQGPRAYQTVLADAAQQVGLLAASDLPPSPALVRNILMLEAAGSSKLHEVLECCLMLVEESLKVGIRSGTDTAVPAALLPIIAPVALAFSRIILSVLIRDAGNMAASDPASGTLTDALLRRLWLSADDVSVVSQFGREERAPKGEDSWDRPVAVTSSPPRAVTVVPRIIDACAHYITRVKLDVSTVQLHVACTKFLQGCMTTALYHDPRFSRAACDILTEYMLGQEYLRSMIMVLLERQIVDPKMDNEEVLICVPTSVREGNGSQPSAAAPGGGGGWLSWLGGAAKTGTEAPISPNTELCSDQPFKAVSVPYSSVMETLSRDLLLQLVYHQRQNGHNTALEVIRTLQVEMPLPLEKLCHAITTNVNTSELLMYTLVVDNPHFLGTLLRKGNPAMFMSQLLYVLARAGSIGEDRGRSGQKGEGWLTWLGGGGAPTTSQQQPSLQQRPITALSDKFKFHLTATLLLILSQDMTINSNLWSTKWLFVFEDGSDTVPWVPSGHHGPISLGTHWILLLCKGISKSIIMRWFDAAITLTAALQNAAPFFHHLESSASQRLAHLLSSTVKRLCRLCTLVAAERLRKADNEHVGSDNPLATEEIEALVHVVCGVAEGIVGAITVSDRKNQSLFYELLYNKPLLRLEPIQPISGSISADDSLVGYLPKVTTDMINDVAGEHRYCVLEALSPIQDVMDQVESELASVSVNHTPAAILELIRHVVESQAVLVSRMPTPGNTSMGSMPNMEGGTTSRGHRSRSPSVSTSRNPRQSLPNCLEVAYVYEEGADCNGLFTPMVWAVQLGALFDPGNLDCSLQVGCHMYGDPCSLPLLKPRERLHLPH